MNYPPGSTSVSVDVLWVDDLGFPVTGKVAADFPAAKWSNGDNTADTAITLSDLALITTAHPNNNTAGGVKEREGGYYRLDTPNNMWTAAGKKTLTFVETTNKHFIVAPFDCQYQQVDLTKIKTQTVTATAGFSFDAQTTAQASIASITIAGGKVAATMGAGDLTGAQTFSMTGNITGNLSGSVGSISGVTFPTNFGNGLITLDGYFALDWGHIKAPTTTQNFSGTTVNTTTNLTIAPPDSAGVGTLLGRIGSSITISGGKVAATIASGDDADAVTLLGRVTTARAGYLDNLNVGGVVASHADIAAINQSASKHILAQTVGQYERPESGTTTYTVEVRTYSAVTGAAVNADTTPTLTATGAVSGSLAANVGVASNPATGVYRYAYSVISTATNEQIRFDASATITTATFDISCYSQVVDDVSVTWTATNAAQLTSISNKLPSGNIADQTNLLATKAELDTVNTQTTASAIRLALGFGSANADTQLNNIYTAMATAVILALVKSQTDKIGTDDGDGPAAQQGQADAASAVAGIGNLSRDLDQRIDAFTESLPDVGNDGGVILSEASNQPSDMVPDNTDISAAATSAAAVNAKFTTPRLAKIDGAQQANLPVILPDPAPNGYGGGSGGGSVIFTDGEDVTVGD